MLFYLYKNVANNSLKPLSLSKKFNNTKMQISKNPRNHCIHAENKNSGFYEPQNFGNHSKMFRLQNLHISLV